MTGSICTVLGWMIPRIVQWLAGGCRACNVSLPKIRDRAEECEASVEQEHETGEYSCGEREERRKRKAEGSRRASA